MEFLAPITSLINAVLDMALTMIYFDFLFGGRKETVSLWKWLLSYGFMELLLYGNSFLPSLIDFFPMTLICGVIGISTLIFITFLYPAKTSHRIFAALSYQALCMVAEVLGYYLTQTVMSTLFQEDVLIGSSLPLFCSKMFMALFIFLVGLVYRSKKHEVTIQYSILLLYSPVIGIVLIYSVCSAIFSLSSIYAEWLIVVSCALLAFMNISNYLLLNSVIEGHVLKERQTFLTAQLNLQSEKYDQSITAYKNTRSIIHDIKKHILYIRECAEHGDSEEIKRYINTHIEDLERVHSPVNTGNLAIDAMVNHCLRTAKENRISAQTDIQIASHELKLENYDLCIILGNLLDNAVNAAKQVPAGEKPEIQIELFTTSKELMIHVCNTTILSTPAILDSVLFSQNMMFSEHGYGLQNIERIAQKYNATTIFEQHEHQFEASVIIPLC